MSQKLPGLSLMCLAYNEEENVRWALPQLIKLMDDSADDWEIVVVCNRLSTDGTIPYLEQQHAADPRIRPVFQPEGTRGYGPAFAYGLTCVTKPFTFHTDIDGQFLFEDLRRAIDLQRQNDADFVHFNRHRRQDRVERKIIGFCFKLLVHTFYRSPVWDFDSAFNLFRTEFVKKIELTANSGVLVPEFMIKFGQLTSKFVVGKTAHQPRRAGEAIWAKEGRVIPVVLPDRNIVRANLIDIFRLIGMSGTRFIA